MSALNDPSPASAGEHSPKTSFAIGTRQSALALTQTSIATTILQSAYPHFSFSVHKMATMGDKNQTTALHQFNAKSLWTSELEAQLLDGTLDLVVHSLKDMPTQLPTGCALGAACSRAERRDCVVMNTVAAERGWHTLADLPAGSVVGTSSVRRIAQLRRLFPHLRTEDVRGNIGTRLRKLDEEDGKYTALILAATGIQRLELGHRVSSFLSWTEGGWLGPVGQGALGVEMRHGDTKVEELCETLIQDKAGETEGTGRRCWLECLAERMMLRTLEGGCSVPLGVETSWEGEQLTIHGIVISVDGQEATQASQTQRVTTREEAEGCGLAIAKALVEKGAGKILEEITLNRKIVEQSGGA